MKFASKILILLLPMGVASCNFYRDKLPAGTPFGDVSQLSYANIREKVLLPRCIGCHGTAGGVSLESYADVQAHLADVRRSAVVERTMPKGGYLTDEQVTLLRAWIDAGAPENAPAVPSVPQEPLVATFNSIRKNIFEPKCVSCHSAGGSAKNILLTDYNALMNSPRDLVLPKDAEESGLMIAITRTDKKRMPPASSGGRALSEAEVDAIRTWIENGAVERN